MVTKGKKINSIGTDEKVLTREQLQRRINNAIVFVKKTKDYVGVFFDDKGLRLELADDCAIISTMFHRHVFNMVTSSGISKPYVFVGRAIDIALTNDCTLVDENGNTTRSYAKLLEVLKAKEDKTEYHIMWYVDLWLTTIFNPLYSIGESVVDSFLVYERYLHETAHHYAIMQSIDETKEKDVTNLEFFNKVMDAEKSFVEGLEESVLFTKVDAKEKAKEEAEALNEMENNELMAKNKDNESKD